MTKHLSLLVTRVGAGLYGLQEQKFRWPLEILAKSSAMIVVYGVVLLYDVS